MLNEGWGVSGEPVEALRDSVSDEVLIIVTGREEVEGSHVVEHEVDVEHHVPVGILVLEGVPVLLGTGQQGHEHVSDDAEKRAVKETIAENADLSHGLELDFRDLQVSSLEGLGVVCVDEIIEQREGNDLATERLYLKVPAVSELKVEFESLGINVIEEDLLVVGLLEEAEETGIEVQGSSGDDLAEDNEDGVSTVDVDELVLGAITAATAFLL
ncbi:hypothetical protein JMJ77_0006389 [Colletotrichum scovillei]|uniref:Uncharacterized protein n=1 Tax=Colletotrichum scovillei TaxID=1209932 RepID=A0A9P7UJ51_9PEZI|nr:hypothetical protein JMJ77_0006389 [Colletotrichum scovillei]KAG7077663.1 hypothetical protein JMJ76_0014908 [Colletotrichum scovillei]KAG7084793.1 hypothetical protein JMJ78_0010225 [Colletotrichum scovillei]